MLFFKSLYPSRISHMTKSAVVSSEPTHQGWDPKTIDTYLDFGLKGLSNEI
jgi:hypothetical protein